MVVLGERTYELDDIRDCDINDGEVNIAGGSRDGFVLLLQGNTNEPETFLVSLTPPGEISYGYAPGTSQGARPPQISASDSHVEVIAHVFRGGLTAGTPVEASVRVACDHVPPGADERQTEGPSEGGATGTGTVEIAGQRHELVAGPVCSVAPGIQLSMASADGVGLDATMMGSAGFILLSGVLDGQWTPAGELSAFSVTGSSATWSGLMADAFTGREELVTIAIDCGAGS